MARAPMPPDANGAPFVRNIVSDPKNVPDVMLLYGYLGASSEEGCQRLYLSPDLSNYVDIPASSVLHQMAAPQEQDPYGGVTLWVKKDAALIYKMAPATQALAYYFAGAIQAQAALTPGVPQAGPAPRVATEATPCLNTHANTCHCPVTTQCRNSPAIVCGTQGMCSYIGCGNSLACPTGQIQCDITNLCAITWDCNTQFTCPPVCGQPAAAPFAQAQAAWTPAVPQAGPGPRVATEATPCLNTHANTCNCPVTTQCRNSPAIVCGSQGRCSYIGCGGSLACPTGQIQCNITNLCAITWDCNTQFTCPPVCAQPAAAAPGQPQAFGGVVAWMNTWNPFHQCPRNTQMTPCVLV